MILIVSASTDPHAVAIRDRLISEGTSALLVDLTEFPAKYELSVSFDSETSRQVYRFFDGTEWINFADARAVWWRVFPASFSEIHSSWAGLLRTLDIFRINTIVPAEWAVQFAQQLRVARLLGFNLPETCITNDVKIAEEFIAKHGRGNIVHKYFLETEQTWVETALSDDGENAPVIKPGGTPIVLQKRESGTAEFYFTVIGDNTVASKGIPGTIKGDKRKRVRSLAIKCAAGLGVGYGTVRMSAGANGEIYFLDVNTWGVSPAMHTDTVAAVTKTLVRFLKARDKKGEHGPLGAIALSLSGGGYRAAAFHLGAMKMLNELNLLEDVTKLSSASGGTITAIKYMLDYKRGASFQRFEDNLTAFMKKVDVVAESVAGLLETRANNKENAMPSLIRSAAGVYARQLVGNRTLGDLEAEIHIKEAAFNSTDFVTGTNFRFLFGGGRSGSSKKMPSTGVSENIRLADIIAASACFPGGFEPFRFPSDFVWEKPLEEVRKDLGKEFEDDVPLMDGGIFDNQATDSIKLFLDRKDNFTDFFIVSDSSARKEKIYDRVPFTPGINFPAWLLLSIIGIIFLFSLFSIATLGYSILHLICDGSFGSGFFFYLFPFLVSLTVAVLLFAGFCLAATYGPLLSEKTGTGGWKRVLCLTVLELGELLISRATSVWSMTGDVFMRRLRSTGYESIFSNRRLNSISVTNMIYDLDDQSEWEHKLPKHLHPTNHIREKVKRAERYPTTLDFNNKPHALENLVKCGQATMCFNILRYLYQFKSAELKDHESPFHILVKRVEIEWKKFNTPY